jgi:dTDP-4-amino-4,6-dideoxygalactose transaminase
MKRLNGIVQRRRELADRYTKSLQGHPWLRPPYVPDGAEPNFQSYAVTLTSKAPVSRDELMQRLLESDITTRRGIMLAHLEPSSRELNPPRLPISEEASRNSLLLPLYPQLTDDEQQRVITALQKISRATSQAA